MSINPPPPRSKNPSPFVIDSIATAQSDFRKQSALVIFVVL